MALEEYARKRKFTATPEPRGKARRAAAARARTFVVQLHHASVRHYDFRLEVDGVLRSWAVPKGPSFRLGEKRLAVEVEDHPLEYGSFEGEIPKGNYGAGHVAIFDQGTWIPAGNPADAIVAGKLEFELRGKRLKGHWKMIRTAKAASKPQWLLFKREDEFAGDFEANDLLEAVGVRVSTVGKGTGANKDLSRRSTSLPIAAGAKPKPGSARADSRSAGSSVPADRAVEARRTSALASRASATPGAKRQGRSRLPLVPMLASAVDAAPLGEAWLHEWKWDGYRLTASVNQGEVVISSRNGLDWHPRLPHLVEALQSFAVDLAVDGELVSLDAEGRSDFNALQRALKSDDTAGLSYVLFDLMQIGAFDLTRAQLGDRKELLQQLVTERSPRTRDPRLRYSDHIVGHGDVVFAESRKQHLEGIISKRVDSAYVPGRGRSWLKVKVVDTMEFVIVGYTRPKGSRNGLGALLLAEPEGRGWKYVGRVGSGLSDGELQALPARLHTRSVKPAVELPAHVVLPKRSITWVEPEVVAEVMFRGWGKEGLLRQASFLRIREDVDVSVDATKNVREGGPIAAPSSPQRIVYPDAGITKQQVFDYYLSVGDRLLEEIGGRPLSILRCPEGIQGPHFFQKHAGPGFGEHVKRFDLREKAGGKAEYFFVDSLAGLMNLVQMNAIEFHPWGSRISQLEMPDRLVFDLDPDASIRWPEIKRAAREVQDRLRAIGLESWPRLSGGKGVHVVVPLEPDAKWNTVRAFCEAFAEAMASEQPERYVATMSLAKRRGRIFIDWLRNGRGATSIASWSLRARAGAPAAVPLTWAEFARVRTPARYSLRDAASQEFPATVADLVALKQTLPLI